MMILSSFSYPTWCKGRQLDTGGMSPVLLHRPKTSIVIGFM